ncbi:MAG: c-type cytochrome domain-containing protein [Myxococcota bacterium]
MWRAWVLVCAGCDDHLLGGSGHPESGGGGGEGWCAVASVVASDCVGCHSAGGAAGGLDLETEPWGALVEPPTDGGAALVIPGDPDGSLLLQKLTGTQPSDAGGSMPPSGALDAATVDAVRAWIVDGAPEVCAEVPTGGGEGMHPDTWPDPSEHGIGAKFAQLECATSGCHGQRLAGDGGPACASCHDGVVADWTTSCTFCHGDRETGDPAPPQDIDDEDDPARISFPPHRLHLDASELHADWGCPVCHQEPTDVFSPGHLQFGGDASPGRAEVTFAGGLGAGGDYEAATRTCDVYCHGPLTGTGRVSATDEVGCGGCHPTTVDAWEDADETHEAHLDEGISCEVCHPTGTAQQISSPADHVDGVLTLELPEGMTRSGGTCTGTCHSELHQGRSWGG